MQQYHLPIRKVEKEDKEERTYKVRIALENADIVRSTLYD